MSSVPLEPQMIIRLFLAAAHGEPFKAKAHQNLGDQVGFLGNTSQAVLVAVHP